MDTDDIALGLRGQLGAFVTRARHLSGKWINNSKGQVATLVLAPSLILGLAVVIGFASAVATQPGCIFGQLIGKLMLSQDDHQLLCRSVPMWGDIPSLMLCFTSSFAVGLFWVFVTDSARSRRRWWLPAFFTRKTSHMGKQVRPWPA